MVKSTLVTSCKFQNCILLLCKRCTIGEGGRRGPAGSLAHHNALDDEFDTRKKKEINLWACFPLRTGNDKIVMNENVSGLCVGKLARVCINWNSVLYVYQFPFILLGFTPATKMLSNRLIQVFVSDNDKLRFKSLHWDKLLLKCRPLLSCYVCRSKNLLNSWVAFHYAQFRLWGMVLSQRRVFFLI